MIADQPPDGSDIAPSRKRANHKARRIVLIVVVGTALAVSAVVAVLIVNRVEPTESAEYQTRQSVLADLREQVAQGTSEVQRLQSELDLLLVDLEAADAALAELETEEAAADSELARRNDQLSALSSEITALTRRLAELARGDF